MLVTEVRRISEKKKRICLEDGSSFVLYNTEIRKLGIRGMEDLPEDVLRLILNEILRRRACLRCMNLLKSSDRTVFELRERLVRDSYPEEVIRSALAYVASYHYTDDERYARNYIHLQSGRKSRRQMEYDLMRKGVDRELVRAALLQEPEEEAGEEAAIRTLARKRGYDPETAGEEDRARFFRYLCGKGFGYESIRRVLD